MSWNKPEFGKSASDKSFGEGLDADHVKWLEESGMAQHNPAAARHAAHSPYSDEFGTEAQQPYGQPHPTSQEAAMNEVAQALSRLMQSEGRTPRAHTEPQPRTRDQHMHAPHAHNPQIRDPQIRDPHTRDPQNRDPWHRSDLRSGLDQSTSPHAYEDQYDTSAAEHLYARAGISRDPLMHPRPPVMRRQEQAPLPHAPEAYAPQHRVQQYAEPASMQPRMHQPSAHPAAPAQPEKQEWAAPVARQEEDPNAENSKVKRISSVLDALNALDERLNSLAHNENEKGKGVPPKTENAAPMQEPKPAPVEQSWAPAAHDYAHPPVTQMEPRFNAGAMPHGVEARQSQKPAAPQPAQTAEYSELNTMIDGHFKQLASQLDTLREPDEARFEQLHDGMQTQLNSLRDEMMDRTSDNRSQLSEIIGRLRDEEGNGLLLKELRHELEQMKSALSRSDIEDSLNALGMAHASIQSRLQELAEKNVDPAIYESLSERMAEVENQIRQLPRVDQLNSLENRLSSMGDRLEDVLLRSGTAGLEVVRDEVAQLRQVIDRLDSGRMIHDVDQRIRFLTARMDELDHFSAIQRDIQSRLSSVETRMPDGEVIDRLHGRLDSISNILAEGPEKAGNNDQLNRLEDRLSDIGQKLDRMEKSPEASTGFDQAFSSIEGRLDHLCNKVDGIEVRLAETSFEVALNENESAALARLEQRVMTLTQMVEDSAHAGSSDKAMSMIRAEITELRGHIGALATSGDIETQLQELAATISSPSGLSSDVEIDRLEQQIADLSHKLDMSQTQFGAIGNLENSFGTIEQEIKGLHTDMVDKAQQIAQDAVKAATDNLALGNGAEQGEAVEAAISALRLDLQSLLEASGPKDDVDQHALQDVRDVLGTISHRLENLESIRHAIGNTEISNEHQKLVGDTQISSILGAFTMGRKGNSADQAALAAEPEGPRNRKADFIAAARRAAKAAAKEAKTAKQEEEKPASGTSKAPERARRLRDYISPNRTKNIEVPENLRAKKAAATAEVLSKLQVAEEPISLSSEDIVSETETAVKEPINLSAAPVELGKVETETKGKKKESKSSRRRAIMLAAAALLLTIGALKVYDTGLFSSSDSVDTAGSDTPPSIMAPDAPMPGKDNSSLLSGGVDAIAAPDVVSRVSSMPSGAELPSPVSSTSIWQSGSATAPSEPTKELIFGQATDIGGGNSKSQPAQRVASNGAADPITTASVPTTQATASGFGEQVTPIIPQQPVQQVAPKQSAYDLPYAIGPIDLRTAAATGEAAAQFEVARRYTEGNLVPANLGAAADWYRKAAAQGLAPAQYRLGSFYEKGRGVEKDLAQARDWYSLAAAQGNIKAMHNLAVLFVEGIDDKPDYTSAVKWFRIAADHGVADSKFNLAILAARGLGMKQDLVESYKWFALAALQGDDDAAGKRDEVAASLTKRQHGQALEAVATYQMKPVDPAANKVMIDTKWSGKPKTTVSQAGSPSVKKIQQALLDMGYDPGNPDGVMGPNTRRAIKSLQARLGMEATGEPDRRLMTALASQTI
ncbi:peptidoglycan-binding protein [Pseudovibrio ascidiaceicola]|uniref:peptidoglycan-binding protein n=1 Tax=Pseudovibrio ascidiaceicola TaxID=285279 RepID=UPI000D6909C2|nr:peptidoglycan-binding protein [Pseudovibrio ascidiaceicola]